jgi:hypothetical protein
MARVAPSTLPQRLEKTHRRRVLGQVPQSPRDRKPLQPEPEDKQPPARRLCQRASLQPLPCVSATPAPPRDNGKLFLAVLGESHEREFDVRGSEAPWDLTRPSRSSNDRLPNDPHRAADTLDSDRSHDQVVMPVGGAGGSAIRSGGGSGSAPSISASPSQKRQSVVPAGRAALGAISPRKPSRQSASPTS